MFGEDKEKSNIMVTAERDREVVIEKETGMRVLVPLAPLAPLAPLVRTSGSSDSSNSSGPSHSSLLTNI